MTICIANIVVVFTIEYRIKEQYNKSIIYIMKIVNTIALCSLAGMSVVEGFVPSSSTLQNNNKISTTKNTELYFFGGGSANKDDLDEQVCLFICVCV